MNGWIKLHRQLIDNGWMQDHPVFITMVYCLLKASHKDGEFPHRGDRISVGAGQFIFGRHKASEDTCLSPQQIRTAIKKLEKYNFLTIRSTKRFSVVSICNWEAYQGSAVGDQPSDQPDINQELTNKQPRANHIQEGKEVKEVKKNKTRGVFAKPTIDQVRDYVNHRVSEGNPFIDAEAFVNHYESNGWKVGRNPMKSWKAAIVTWEKRRKEFPSAHARSKKNQTATGFNFSDEELSKQEIPF